MLRKAGFNQTLTFDKSVDTIIPTCKSKWGNVFKSLRYLFLKEK